MLWILFEYINMLETANSHQEQRVGLQIHPITCWLYTTYNSSFTTFEIFINSQWMCLHCVLGPLNIKWVGFACIRLCQWSLKIVANAFIDSVRVCIWSSCNFFVNVIASSLMPDFFSFRPTIWIFIMERAMCVDVVVRMCSIEMFKCTRIARIRVWVWYTGIYVVRNFFLIPYLEIDINANNRSVSKKWHVPRTQHALPHVLWILI